MLAADGADEIDVDVAEERILGRFHVAEEVREVDDPRHVRVDELHLMAVNERWGRVAHARRYTSRPVMVGVKERSGNVDSANEKESASFTGAM